MRWVFVVALVGCYKDPHFGDCEVACTVTCPGDLTCVAGACRAPGMSGACAVQPGGDAGTGRDGSDADVDASGPDSDGDTIPDSTDNCPSKPNRDQGNEDGDMFGDVCDPCPIGPTAADNTDSDMDGVGDGCDPHPNLVGDAIDVFEGFNSGAKPSAATEFGPGTWTYDAVAGTAHVVGPASADSKLVWAINGQNGTTTTRVALTSMGSPATAGVTDVSNAVVGVACENQVSAAAGNTLILTNGGNPMTANPSTFSEGAPYVIALTRTGSTNWICHRGDSPTVSGQLSAGAFNRGIVAKQASATFEYVMIVTSP